MIDEELKTLRGSVSDFVKKELSKDFVLERDLTINSFSWDIVKKGEDLGYLSMLLSEDDGGQGLDMEGFSTVIEELAYGSAGIANIFLIHNVAQLPLMSNKNVKNKFLLPIIQKKSAENPGLFSIILPTQHNISVTGKDGDYIVNGTADFVFNGKYADLLILFGQDNKCFVIPTGKKGIFAREVYALGLRASRMARVQFDNVELDGSNLISTSKETFKDALSYTNIGVASLSLGIARKGFDETLKYAKERYQAGTALINHRHIRRMLAGMYTGIEAAKSLISRACKEKENEYLARVARIFSSDMAMQSATDAVQVHAGVGYMHDTGIEILMRDAEYCQTFPEGTIRDGIDIIAEIGNADKTIYV